MTWEIRRPSHQRIGRSIDPETDKPPRNLSRRDCMRRLAAAALVTMLKSPATILMGISFCVLATVELAISPGHAQKLQPKIAQCRPLVADWTHCWNGRFQRCHRIGLRKPDVAGGCIWETHCTPTGRGCLARPL